jgi:hypothetical protein
MTDWPQYVKTKTTANSLSAAQQSEPSAREYLAITFIENWVAILCLLLIMFFFIGGAILDYNKLTSASYFFDGGKIITGFLVGTFAPRGSKK